MPLSMRTPVQVQYLKLRDLSIGGLGRVITNDSVFHGHIIYRTDYDTFVDLSDPHYVWPVSADMRHSEMIPLPAGTLLTVD